jgi:hypothetical protein
MRQQTVCLNRLHLDVTSNLNTENTAPPIQGQPINAVEKRNVYISVYRLNLMMALFSTGILLQKHQTEFEVDEKAELNT